ncbi:hypothetical protein SASPL_140058 [Salvia splendens]|uniref:Glycosyltransferase N-terminal domain-containing protein n=1 Tax=Salvia splendens TaxID=180675 RepID=A0A8X8ZB94_SALSN|nr:hypothetical protein SASPL_140058 [Salvia splendens]
MNAKQGELRVLMFPWLAHGHVIPFLELAKGLAKKHFHVYLCSTSINLDSVRNSLNNNDHIPIELVELPLPDLPPHYYTTKNFPPHLMPTLVEAFQMSAPAFSDIIADLKPDLLIYDGFQPWAARAAAAQGIPPIFFSTSGSTSLAFFHHHHTHKSWDSFPSDAIRLKEHEKRAVIAAGESIKVENVDDGDFIFGTFKLSCEIVLIKRLQSAFEGEYMDYLSSLCERKLVPTGPLIAHGDDEGVDDRDLEMMRWLGEREEGSTLYISFGSENYASKEQMEEIA